MNIAEGEMLPGTPMEHLEFTMLFFEGAALERAERTGRRRRNLGEGRGADSGRRGTRCRRFAR